jgi:hypothetical protein
MKGDVVIAAKLDRLFRSAIDALTVVEDLRKRVLALHLLELGGDISGNGLSKLFLTIAAAFAEAERDRIRERIGQVKADPESPRALSRRDRAVRLSRWRGRQTRPARGRAEGDPRNETPKVAGEDPEADRRGHARRAPQDFARGCGGRPEERRRLDVPAPLLDSKRNSSQPSMAFPIFVGSRLPLIRTYAFPCSHLVTLAMARELKGDGDAG